MVSNTPMFLNGNGVAKDLKQAFKFFSIATGSTSLPRQQAVLALSCSVTQGWQ
jgi:TPR repeat protein